MQNWNSVVNYVKANLGTKNSSIEITDDEFVNYFKEQTLPYFSQIIPRQYWILLNNSNLVSNPSMYTHYNYEIKLPDDIILIDVASVYMSDYFMDERGLDSMYMNPADVVMANTLNDMSQFLRPVADYQFIKPRFIRFNDTPTTNEFIVELNIEHTLLDTIPGDMYNKLFRNMCLVDGLELVINNRNKFTNLTTPFGQIDLNIDYITQRMQELRLKNDELIDGLPHREFLEIF